MKKCENWHARVHLILSSYLQSYNIYRWKPILLQVPPDQRKWLAPMVLHKGLVQVLCHQAEKTQPENTEQNKRLFTQGQDTIITFTSLLAWILQKVQFCFELNELSKSRMQTIYFKIYFMGGITLESLEQYFPKINTIQLLLLAFDFVNCYLEPLAKYKTNKNNS